MSKSERVTAARELAALRLVNECRELGDDAAAWQARLVDGLLALTGGMVIAAGAAPPHGPDGLAVLADWADQHIDGGWPSAAVRDRWVGYGKNPRVLAAHPAIAAFFARPEPDLTLTRRELVGDRAWDDSPFVNSCLRPDGFDEGLASRVVVPAFGTSYVVTVLRAVREPPFRPAVGRLVARVQRELAPHLGRGLLLTTQPNRHGLTPRLRELLDRLLAGDSEKQAAVWLGLSVGTVHQYVKQVYRHFGVNSRPELLAYFLRRHRRSGG